MKWRFSDRVFAGERYRISCHRSENQVLSPAEQRADFEKFKREDAADRTLYSLGKIEKRAEYLARSNFITLVIVASLAGFQLGFTVLFWMNK